ncbi:MAG: putative cadmium-transporting ATPase [bacterium ADurb.Bin363]|nr:MAG: putative cadmium-transporting ATPase [bacterium ADurb.Bin363]
MIERLKYKIRGLDCAEEVKALRDTVGMLPGIKELDFDILNGRMDLAVDTLLTSEGDIFKAVSKAGLQASSLSSSSDIPWHRQGHVIMCLLGGVFLIAGSISHGIISKNFYDVFICGELTSGHNFPRISIFLYLLSIVFSIWYIAPKALNSLKSLRLDINFLMILAITGAIAIGQWFESSTVIFLFALARVLESWSMVKARREIETLMELSPQKARYICPHDGNIEEKPVTEVPVGVIVLVRPGEKIPLDGIITKGKTSVNQSPITGEAIPVVKEEGHEVFAGTINEDGAIEVKVSRPAEDTALARIIRMVEEARLRRSPLEQWVEKFARYYTPVMILISIFIALIPPLFLSWPWVECLYRALVILVIACPCALVISTPVSIVAGLTSAARNGILIKGGIYLESPADLYAIALDKTGTLTYGHPEVKDIIPFNSYNSREILSKASSLESQSKHPLAKAILSRAIKEGIEFTSSETFSSIKGKGAEGFIEGKFFWIGSHRFMEEKGKETPEFHKKAEELESLGYSVVALGNDREVCGLISISDSVRPQATSVIKSLKELGIKKIIMLTGDNRGTAESVATQTGVDDFKAGLLPEDKVKTIENLVKEFKSVAMVGDGVNDAPAMALSTVGIAMGDIGTDVAIEASDIVLMSDDLSKLPWLIKHSRRTLSIIRQNIFFALAFKFLFMGLAIAGLATLWMAILADMGASLLVIFNGLRLMR